MSELEEYSVSEYEMVGKVHFVLSLLDPFLYLDKEQEQEDFVGYCGPILGTLLDTIDHVVENQRHCPDIFFTTDAKPKEWRSKLRRWEKQVKCRLSAGEGGSKVITDRMSGLTISPASRRYRLQRSPQTPAERLLKMTGELMGRLTRLIDVLDMPSPEALERLFDFVCDTLEESCQLSDEVEKYLHSKVNRCRHGRPSSSSVERWIRDLVKEAAAENEDGAPLNAHLKTVCERMKECSGEADTHEAVARYFYTEKVPLDELHPILLFVKQMEALERLKAATADAPEPAAGERQLEAPLQELLEGLDEPGGTAEKIWLELTAQNVFATHLHEAGSCYKGINLRFFCNCVGRLQWHGVYVLSQSRLRDAIVEGREKELDKVSRETLRKYISEGQQMEKSEWRSCRTLIDTVAKTLAGRSLSHLV